MHPQRSLRRVAVITTTSVLVRRDGVSVWEVVPVLDHVANSQEEADDHIEFARKELGREHIYTTLPYVGKPLDRG